MWPKKRSREEIDSCSFSGQILSNLQEWVVTVLLLISNPRTSHSRSPCPPTTQRGSLLKSENWTRLKLHLGPKAGGRDFWPTRPQLNRWSLFSHMVSICLFVHHKKTRYQADGPENKTRAIMDTMRENSENNDRLLAIYGHLEFARLVMHFNYIFKQFAASFEIY